MAATRFAKCLPDRAFSPAARIDLPHSAGVQRSARIATHEASHAVAARLVRLPDCGGATIVESGPHGAHAAFPCDRSAASVVALMGGAVGELLAFGDFDQAGAAHDWTNISYWLPRLGHFDHGESLVQYTTRLLLPHRGLIHALALRLERKLVLDGPTIDRIVGRWRG